MKPRKGIWIFNFQFSRETNKEERKKRSLKLKAFFCVCACFRERERERDGVVFVIGNSGSGKSDERSSDESWLDYEHRYMRFRQLTSMVIFSLCVSVVFGRVDFDGWWSLGFLFHRKFGSLDVSLCLYMQFSHIPFF